MKKYFLFFILSLFALYAKAQSSYTLGDYFNYFQQAGDKCQQLHKEGKYQEEEEIFISNLKKLEEVSLTEEDPKRQKKLIEALKANIYYNLACVRSLQNKKKEAIEALEKAIAFGYNDYRHTKTDEDFINIRKEKKFLVLLEKLRPFDKLVILQQAGGYQKQQTDTLPRFTYQSAKDPSLEHVRNYFKLDSVAGKGDELSKIFNLLRFVHNNIAHDGGNYALCEFDAIDIYNYHKATKKGVNCRHLAITLNEMYLAMGIPSRYVTCMPKDPDDMDCHVINSVYSQQLQKWIWIDPTNNAYVKDENGNLLSIAEVRDRLIHNKPLVLNEDANWNNQKKQTKEEYLESYMAKNLYWFSCPLQSRFNPESRFRKTDTSYVALLPEGFTIQKGIEEYITNDPDYFWQKP